MDGIVKMVLYHSRFMTAISAIPVALLKGSKRAKALTFLAKLRIFVASIIFDKTVRPEPGPIELVACNLRTAHLNPGWTNPYSTTKWNRIGFIFTVFCFWVLLRPVDASATKYAGEFLSIGVGPRALAMGGAFTGVADDVTAGYWNPAGLAGATRRMAAIMHSEQLSGLAYDYFAYAQSRGTAQRATGFAVSIIRLGLDDIPITKLPDPTKPIDALLQNGQRNRPYVDRFVSDAEYAVLLSISRRSSPRFAIGANLKLIRKGVGVASALGAGLDVGVLIQPISTLKVGVQIMNVTSTIMTWSTGRKEYVSPIVKTGVSYRWDTHRLRGSALIAADVDVLFEGRKNTAATSLGRANAAGHLGVEYCLQRMVTFRSGLDANGLTAGIGVRSPRVRFFGQSLIPSFDYALVNNSAFGAIHRVGVSLEF